MCTHLFSLCLCISQFLSASVCWFRARRKARVGGQFMATFTKLESGRWRVQLRRTRKYASRTFRLRGDGELWARESEQAIEPGKRIEAPKIDKRSTFGALIRLHIQDMLASSDVAASLRDFCSGAYSCGRRAEQSAS